MNIASLSEGYRQVRQWWRRPSRRRKSRSDQRARPLAFETLETRLVPAAGTWTALAHAPLDDIGTMMLLSDGTVLAQGAGGSIGVSQKWYKLTPDPMGSYANGTWSSLTSMHLARLYYGSNMLPDGRIFLVGGEYSGSQGRQNFTNTGEIYNPVTNTWTNIAPFPRTMFGDDPTEVLPDGRVLAGYLAGPQTYIYDPATNSWTATAGSKVNPFERSDEESWLKMPDGSILTHDIFASYAFGSFKAERYNPSTDRWTDESGMDPTNPPGPLSGPEVGYELGPAFLLPDGRAFVIGAGTQNLMTGAFSANTALYNPMTRQWAAGPVVPNQLGADDAPGAMMPNGHVLFAADHLEPHYFTGPTSVFEYDPAAPPTTAYTNVTPAPSIMNLSDAAYVTRMLVLPNGQVLYSNGYRQLAVYTPVGSPSNAWRPTISGITTDGRGTYTLTGTQLNGISEGAAYGDDAEMASNFPIVRLTALTGGRVYYGRTFNWSSTGVATGSTPETTQFTLPPSLPEGDYNLAVIANGIASTTTRFTYSLASHFSVTPSVRSVTANTPFTITVRALGVTNQTITSYRGTVHFTSDDFQASLPSDYTFTAADNGVHTFTVTLRTAGTDHIDATDTVIGLLTGESPPVTVTAAGVDHLAVFTTAANPDIAGTRFDVIVTAQDAYNNTVTSYVGRVHFTSTDPQAKLPRDYTFTNADRGVHTFTDTGLGETTLSTNGCETVTAVGVVDGISGTAIVNVGGPTHFSVIPSIGSLVAGTSITITVRALDAANRTVTCHMGTVHFTSDDFQAILPADYTFTAADNGVHSFTVTLRTAGNHQIVVTDPAKSSVFGTTIIEFSDTAGSGPNGITTGFDGNLWFTEFLGNTIGRMTPSGSIRKFPIPTAGSGPVAITTGPDGNLWFVESNSNKIGRITPNGAINEFALNPASGPARITAGPDGNLWFTESNSNKIGRIKTDGTLLPEFSIPSAASNPFGITWNFFDGNLWFVERSGNKIGRITPTGTITEFTVPTGNSQPLEITYGFDGNLWFTEYSGNQIGRITPTGSITEYSRGLTANSAPYGITAGPGGNLWFTESNGNQIGRITTAGTITEFAVPTANAGPTGVTTGPDGGLWFAEFGANQFGRLGIDVTPATANHFLVFTTAANPQVAGTPFDVLVFAVDQYGNTVPSYTGTIHFSSADPHPATLPPNYTFTAADQGGHYFPAGATLFTAGTEDVTATDTTSGMTGSASVNVGAAPAVVFQVTAPASTVAGTPFDVTVVAMDRYGNTDTNYSGTVTFSSSDPHPASLPPNYTFTVTDQGVHTFVAGATLFTAGTWDVTATDTSSGSMTGTVNVDVSAAAAVGFRVMAPATVVTGTPFDVTVIAVDPYGNTDTNYTGTVTFSSSDTDPNVVLPADYTFTAGDAGVHTFTDTGMGEITLITLGDQTLTVTDTADNTITGSATITVMPGPGPSQRQDLVGLALAVSPALARPVLALVSPAATSLDRAGLDRFFSAAGSEAGWTRPSLKPSTSLSLLLRPSEEKPGGEVVGADLTLDALFS